MNGKWQQFLGTRGARMEAGTVTDFGDPAGELAAARDATVLCPLLQSGLIACAGDDARTFLHNQLTSDVNHLGTDAAQYSTWCSPKGRMLASFIVCRDAAGLLLLLSADLQEFIQKRLQMYVLRSKVKIARRSDDHTILGLSGPQADAALHGAGLPVPAQPMQTGDFPSGKVIRLDAARFLVIAAGESAAPLWTTLAATARPAGTPAWRWLDIRAGIPWVVDATREAFVPQMANFDKIGGVSFHKGCYPGQEVVARTQYLGKVKRHLYRFHADGPITPGMPVFPAETPEQPCGMVANAAPSPAGGHDGLAVMLEGPLASGGTIRQDGRSLPLADIVAVGD